MSGHDLLRPLHVALLLLAPGCDLLPGDAPEPEALQGVVEHETRRLGFEVGGRVDSVRFEEGDAVAAGDTLAALDVDLARVDVDARTAEVAVAEAQLALVLAGVRPQDRRATQAELRAAREQLRVAERQRDRARALADRGAAPQADAEQVEANYAQAQARVVGLTQRSSAQRQGARDEEQAVAQASVAAARVGLRAAETRLTRQQLVADAPGTVLERLVEPGEVVAPGTPVVVLAELDRPFVDVFVPQGRAAEASVGRRALVRIDAAAEPLEGVVERVGQRTEFTPRYLFSERERPSLVVRVRVRVDDPEHALRAGVPAFVTWRDGGQRDRPERPESDAP
jgi:HlyD family secretion protein